MLTQETIQYLKEMGLNTKAGRPYTRPNMRVLHKTTISFRGFEIHYTLYQTWNSERMAYDNQYIDEHLKIKANTLDSLKLKVDQEIWKL